MKKITGIAIFICALVWSAAAQTDKCYENKGLKLHQIISYTLTGNKIEGTMESGGYDPDMSMEMFDFTGSKRGNVLTIKFLGKPPYELPPRVTKNRITWTLGTKGLNVPTFGKNYDTKKFSAYTAVFEPCKEV